MIAVGSQLLTSRLPTVEQQAESRERPRGHQQTSIAGVKHGLFSGLGSGNEQTLSEIVPGASFDLVVGKG
jgi:hypothetical protein